MKFNRALALGSAILMSASALAASKGSNQRWFEMEVILFSQLSDKALLKEHFPDSQPLPQYKKVVDLLTPYLNPDIAALKQQLTTCGDEQSAQDLISQAITDSRQAFFSPKTLEQIQLTEFAPQQTFADDFSDPAFYNPALSTNEALFSQNNAISEPGTDNLSQRDFTGSATSELAGNEPGTESNMAQQVGETLPEAINTNEPLGEIPELDTGLSPEQAALVNLAEQEFSPIQFNYSPQTLPRSLCRLDQALFDQYQQDHSEYSLNGFTVTQMPLRIDGIEDEYSSVPYLLSKDSLKLRSIVTQLRRSKNFKPLLHLGWRQPTVSRRRAVPLRLFAGDNLQAHYQGAHESYLQDMAESREQEQILAQTLAGQDNQSGLTTAVAPAAQADPTQMFEQRLNLQIRDILAQIDTLDEDVSAQENQNDTGQNITAGVLSDASLLDELNKPQMPLEQNIEDFSEQLMLANAPEPPVQPWFLDGFFKVHVNHYLYITADFNIMDTTLAQQATQALAPQGNDLQESTLPKAINFKQNRRVISGEIHYFDHPYMGMIVQIRRYKRPEPPAQDNE
ncbi:CsiV family protein [Thalassomonas sp. RHCl1]|uniref:CsiV family protein n=1 Tax=Thalassomonas sp. RHCl1 TaxID=2995320 RepID=UPI00248C213D|nr:CsiV family protein [Thalassomonas sp. RHCl1]